MYEPTLVKLRSTNNYIQNEEKFVKPSKQVEQIFTTIQINSLIENCEQ